MDKPINYNEPPEPNQKVCFNCKYGLWAVALGIGFRCMNTDSEIGKRKPPIIPNRYHTCEYFEHKIQNNEKQS